MPRSKIMPKELRKEAKKILVKHGLEFDGYCFLKPKPEPVLYQWDKTYNFQFFSNPDRLNGCCGVIEFHEVYTPNRTYFPNELTDSEWGVLFNYNVRDVLNARRRRMGLITLINRQRDAIPFMRQAGFEQVSEGYNPDTRHKVSVWALSI